LPEHTDTHSVADYLQTLLRADDLAVLSGPNLALELAQQLPGASVVAAKNPQLCRHFQQLFSRPYFRIYTSDDRLGVELGGVLKNVYAFAAGIADGLQLGTNAKSALMTRALAEMVRIGKSMGANTTTFYGLSGIGDLMATAYSQSSRNWQAGFNLAQDKEGHRSDRGIAEGARTALLFNRRLPTMEVPILSAIATVLTGQETVSSVMTQLMQRELKSE
jgi:glycerol-3-phosphate dehydrogenase (NAD(P)+)